MEFKVSWRHWQQEAKNLVQQRVFLSSEKLSHIAGVSAKFHRNSIGYKVVVHLYKFKNFIWRAAEPRKVFY